MGDGVISINLMGPDSPQQGLHTSTPDLNTTCPVCHVDVSNIVTVCGHTFCLPCLTAWTVTLEVPAETICMDIFNRFHLHDPALKATCPICRHPLNCMHEEICLFKLHDHGLRASNMLSWWKYCRFLHLILVWISSSTSEDWILRTIISLSVAAFAEHVFSLEHWSRQSHGYVSLALTQSLYLRISSAWTGGGSTI